MSSPNKDITPIQEIVGRLKTVDGGGNGGGDDMEVRIAKLEVSVEHIESDISEIKSDIREIRAENKSDFQYLNSRIDRLSDKIDTHIYWFVGILVAVFASIGVSIFFRG
jgi:archaellum component FlaC